MKTIFNIGDLVILKSGSPVMTVEGSDKDKRILCVWFNKKGEKCDSSFFAETLNKFSEEDLLSIEEPSVTIEVSNIEEASSLAEVSSPEAASSPEEAEKQQKTKRTKKHHNDEQSSYD